MKQNPACEELERRVQELEKKLHDARFLTEEIMTYMTEGLVLTDTQGTVTFINQRLSEMLGYPPEEIIGKSWLDMVPAQQQAVAQAAEARRARGHTDRYEIVLHHKEGQQFPVMIGAGPRFDKQSGEFIGTMGVVTDITERRQAEESRQKYQKDLEKQNHFIQTILDNLPIGLAVNSTEEEKAVYLNKKFEEIYGWPEQDLKNIDTFFHKAYPDPEYRKKIMGKVLGDIESGDPERMIWEGMEITRQDGEKRFVSAKNIPVHEQKLMISTVQDITENKKLQTQLLQAQKMESVGRLAGGVAHDFNNMLGVILGHTELALLQSDENHDLYSTLKEIQKAAQRSADITKKLLAFARKQTISPRQLDLNDTVESMLNMLRRLIGEDIDLIWKPSTNVWPVKMDPIQIDQILVNLCANAQNAIAGTGRIFIKTEKKSFDAQYCSRHSDTRPGEYVLLAVSDNGCGMDKHILDNLFEPFFTTREFGKSAGMGLATVHGIVNQNNGFIHVYSEPGQGTTFNIYLPRLSADGDRENDG